MKILEMVRRDHDQFRALFDRMDQMDSAGPRPLELDFHQHFGIAGDPDDFEESHLVQSFRLHEHPGEVSLDEIDDRFAVDLWLREIARG
jgi:hypothetical protein